VHPCWVPCDFEWYGEDWRVLVVCVFSCEVFGGEPIHSMVAELLSSEVFCFPFVYMIDGAVLKVFVCVDFHYVERVVRRVLWFGEVLGDGWWWSF
jgi:hypothetical protein